MSSTYLADCAEAIRAAGLAALVPATTGRAAPSVSFVSQGPPPLNWCCDSGMLCVHLARVEHHVSFNDELPQNPCGVLHRPVYIVTVARCWPTFGVQGNDPTPDQMDAAAADQLEDLWALLTEFAERIAHCTLLPGQVACDDVEIGAVEPLPTEGACAGWTIELSTVANDSGPDGS